MKPENHYWMNNGLACTKVLETFPELGEQFQAVMKYLSEFESGIMSTQELELRMALNTYLGLQRNRLYSDLVMRDSALPSRKTDGDKV